MAKMEGWGKDQFAREALYVANRGILAQLVRTSADCADKDVTALLASYMEASAPEQEHQVHVVGGDYFSQSQYDRVKKDGDNIFSRFAAAARPESSSQDGSSEDIADRFATETLARIFAEQGQYDQARRIYSRLVLDIPEKSAYFVSLIDELEQN